MPPKVVFTISIDSEFKVVCYNHSKLTSVRHFLGLSAKLETYSQLNDIIEYMENQPPDLNAELLSCSKFLSSLVDLDLTESEKQ